MKIILLGDVHYGVRNDNQAFLTKNKLFFDNTLFPYMKKNNIDTLVQLGDLVDRRKYINYATLNRLREDFLEPLHAMGVKTHFIVGNHDTTYKNTNKINAQRELIDGKYDDIFSIYEEATEVEFDGTKILFVPWICDDNSKHSFELLANTEAQIVMGHLEIQGFEMYKGSMVSHGTVASLFDRFDMVFSGHFHHKSTNGQIWYLGNIGEFTWSDYDDPKGFHVFDTETRELEFVQNEYITFIKIFYDDSEEINLEDYEFVTSDMMVKVVIKNKNNLYLFDKFIDVLEKANPLDIQIVEDHLNLSLEDDEDIVNEAENTEDIFKKYIQSMDNVNVDKNKLEKKILELYSEAQSLV